MGIVIVHILLGIAVLAVVSCYLATLWGAPWAPTSMVKVDQMLRLACVQPGEEVVDLGAGDGRIVIRAASQFGARAIGVEIDPIRWLIANALIRLRGVADTARVVYGNMFEQDLMGADVVVLYLLQGTNQRLQSHLANQLRPGARIVSHTFSFDGWTPTVIDEDKRLFVYEVGNLGPEVQTRFISSD